MMIAATPLRWEAKVCNPPQQARVVTPFASIAGPSPAGRIAAPGGS